MATKKASEEVIDIPAKKKATTKKAQPKNTSTALSREVGSRERELKVADVIKPIINPAQLNALCGKTPAHVIRTRPGGGGKVYRYIPYGYAVDSLNKAFGFDWDFQLLPMFNGNIYKQTDVESTVNGKIKVSHNLSVYGELTVRIRKPTATRDILTTIVKQGIGSQDWHESNEFGDALKGASSDALKRAAHALGIGLDLYFDEQVELTEYQDKQEKAKKQAEEEAMALVSGTPISGAVLLSRAMSDFKYNGQRVGEILKVDLPHIINAEPSLLKAMWAKLEEVYKDEQK